MNTDKQTMNYDPNMCFCGRMTIQTVKLTLGECEYRATYLVEINSNVRGMEVIDSAVLCLYESLGEDEYGTPTISLFSRSGDEMTVSDDDSKWADFLKEMVIRAEIVSIEENGTFSKENRSSNNPVRIETEF